NECKAAACPARERRAHGGTCGAGMVAGRQEQRNAAAYAKQTHRDLFTILSTQLISFHYLHRLAKLLQAALQAATNGQRAALQMLRNLRQRPVMKMLQDNRAPLIFGQRSEGKGEPL